MKKIRLLISIILVVCCLSVLSACESLPELQKPTNLKIELTNLTLSWKAVPDARLYTVSIQAAGAEAKEFMVSKTTYSLAFLTEGEYTIKVKANGREEEIDDSAWSEPITFVREREPGLVMTLSKDGKSYEVTDKGIATGHIVIPDTYRGKPVTSVGKKAFFNKYDVTGVTFGKNITSIGEMAFANCSYLTEMTLPEGLVYLGNNAFASCRLLAGELVIPEGITEIPNNAFQYCASLTGVKLGSNVQAIGKNAFTNCGGLTSIELPDSLLYLYDYAFAECQNLAEVKLGNNLEIIGPYAFAELRQLSSIQLPDATTTICEGAFLNCEALGNVQMGSGVEMIDLYAFAGTKVWKDCPTNEVYVGKWFLGLKDSSVETLNLREDTYGLANYALYGNTKLVDIVLPNSVKIIGNAAFSNAKIVNLILGNGVEIIGEQAFASCSMLTNVRLGSYDYDNRKLTGSSLKNIGNYAFMQCSALDEIEIPNTVEVIGSYAFNETGIFKNAIGVVYAGNWLVGFTEALAEGNVIVRAGTVGVANYAFYNCEALTGIEMPSSVKHIGRSAFYNCKKLTSVILPYTLEVIEDYTFYHCDSLRLFTLPPALKSIGRSAFYKCDSISRKDEGVEESLEDKLIIPGTVETIGEYAFYGCGKIDQDENLDDVIYGIDIIEIGGGVKYISNSAFYGFQSVRKVIINDGVEEIGEKAFQKCVSLVEVEFGNTLTTIGTKAFYQCGELEHVVLPDNIKRVGDYAFYNCEGLRVLNLGHGLETIGNFAFYACTNLGSVSLPASLQEIGKQAFRNCYSLSSVVLNSSIERIQPHAFYGCNELTIYAESTSALETWDRFWNSSYRPVIWGCTLSEGKDYVVSFTKSAATVENKNSSNVIALPAREGYVCIGWNTNSAATDATYTAENIVDVAEGRKLYAIWVEETN